MITETRERFLLAITAQVPAEQIAEIHFFTPIKQGGVESGVAVVAARHPEPSQGEGEGSLDAAEQLVGGLPDEEQTDEGESDPSEAAPPLDSPPERLVIYTARYRLTLKGPDRGKWETNVVAEADAPLVTVDAVVRGVQRRSGDVDDPTRMDGDEARAILEAKAAAAAAIPGVPAPNSRDESRA